MTGMTPLETFKTVSMMMLIMSLVGLVVSTIGVGRRRSLDLHPSARGPREGVLKWFLKIEDQLLKNFKF